MTNCKKCHQPINGNYCSDCGQPAQLERIDAGYLKGEVQKMMQLEKGFIYTIREVVRSPKYSVNMFLTGSRDKLVKPLVFITLTSLIYTVLIKFFHVEDGYLSIDIFEKTAINDVFLWVKRNYGYGNIIIGIFIAYWINLFFKSYEYNFYEILVLLCYIMGVSMVILSVLALVDGLIGTRIMPFATLIITPYTIWAIAAFFNKRKFVNYLKATAAYFLGTLFFAIGAISVGILLDILNAK